LHFKQFGRITIIQVEISDGRNSCTLPALVDSGAQVSLIKADIIKDFDVSSLGSVRLRGIVGSPIDANLVKLNLRMRKSDGFLSVVMAVAENINDDLVLTTEIVNRLSRLSAQSEAYGINVDSIDYERSDSVN